MSGQRLGGAVREMLSGIRFVCKEDNIRKMNHHTPILFISGAMDMVGDCSKAWSGPLPLSSGPGCGRDGEASTRSCAMRS